MIVEIIIGLMCLLLLYAAYKCTVKEKEDKQKYMFDIITIAWGIITLLYWVAIIREWM